MEHELNKNGVASVSGIINSNYDIGSIVAIIQAVNQNAEVLSELIDRLPKEKTTVHDDTAFKAAYKSEKAQLKEAVEFIKSYCNNNNTEDMCSSCCFIDENDLCKIYNHLPLGWDPEWIE